MRREITDKKLFQIGDVAKMFHISVGSLRHYEQAGLLKPEYIDENSGYRYYSTRQFEVLNTIRYLRLLDMPLNQKVFLAQFDTIKKIAEEESCVIVGRCADYALADYPGVTTVFIHGELEDKLNYLMEYYKLPLNKAKEFMVKTDKSRASYYNYYADKRWGSLKSYDICINSSMLGHEGTADFLVELINRRFQ